MTADWYLINSASLLARLSVGHFAVRCGRFFELPFWTIFCLWGLPQAWWMLSGAHRNASPWYTPMLALGLFLRIAVTIEAINLMLFTDIGLSKQRRRFGWSGGLAMASTALLFKISSIGYIRILCFTAALLVLFAWAWRLYATVPWIRKHMVLISIWLGSAAFASAAGSVAGDAWDLAATAIQAVCFCGWVGLMRRKT